MKEHQVFVEAEGFENLGGWVVDGQFMDQMGSPFLLAHGCGIPVPDASTKVNFGLGGQYRVWVRTRDWSCRAETTHEPSLGAFGASPGAFEVCIDGKALKTVFGLRGSQWHWEDGGTISLTSASITLSLHDLGGFDGRCDAILFSSNLRDAPPNTDPDLARLRRELLGMSGIATTAGSFDLVIVGGGLAGTCAAVSAARGGLRVALIQDRPVLGGCNSSEVRVPLQGTVNHPPYPRVGDIVNEIDPQQKGSANPAIDYADAKKLSVVLNERNITLFMNMHAVSVTMAGAFIAEVIAQDMRTGGRLSFQAPLFVDCTGDGSIGFLAGAEYRAGREARSETGEALAPLHADSMTLGSTILWRAITQESSQPFPETPWAIAFSDETCVHATKGRWDWETGMHRDQVADAEAIRDYMLRAIYGNWAFLKNRSARRAEYAKYSLDWVGYVIGKRESRRLLGDVVVSQQDIVEQRSFSDGCVATSWPIDLHYPRAAVGFQGEPFLSVAEQLPVGVFLIPYRALYSRNVVNLMMAGRNISVTHVALGSVRVMVTTGMMGEVIGKAALLCRRHECLPRDVYGSFLRELLGSLE